MSLIEFTIHIADLENIKRDREKIATQKIKRIVNYFGNVEIFKCIINLNVIKWIYELYADSYI